MNTPSLVFSTVLSPLQNLFNWLGHSQEQRTSFCQPPMQAATKCQTNSKVLQRKPLRIVRVLEAGQTSSQVGRMVISGRMADVCAELDRLVACESARH